MKGDETVDFIILQRRVLFIKKRRGCLKDILFNLSSNLY